jgi:hypothetical protein
MIYPCDTITIPFLLLKNSSLTLLPSSEHTILSVLLQPSGLNIAGQAQDIKSGDLYLAFNGSQNIPQTISYMSYYTNNEIKASNSSLLYNSVGQISFINRNIASSSAPCLNYASNQNASTTNGFTHGEILISFFLFLFMVAGVFSFIVRRTIRE